MQENNIDQKDLIANENLEQEVQNENKPKQAPGNPLWRIIAGVAFLVLGAMRMQQSGNSSGFIKYFGIFMILYGIFSIGYGIYGFSKKND
jgi:uncharacterized membrane protein HdeD (DUF308 family)